MLGVNILGTPPPTTWPAAGSCLGSPTTRRRNWDALSPGGTVENWSVSPTRLYLVTLEWDAMPVNVFDLRTGTLLARLGAASRY
jgi:hypothetical protein